MKMQNNKLLMTSIVNKLYVSEFGENVFSNDGSVLFRKLRETRVSLGIFQMQFRIFLQQ